MKRIVSAIILTLLLAIVPPSFTIRANPVPYPVIGMPYEYIYANITVNSSGAYARVNGTYPFENYGFQNISMYYPLPKNSTNISVKIDGNPVPWSYSNNTYPTIFGDLPMINWTLFFINPYPEYFSLEVDYEHAVPIIDQNFTYFYAMGTWMNLLGEIYPFYAPTKQTTAYVTVDINMAHTLALEIHAYEITRFTTSWGTCAPLDCTMHPRSGNVFRVNVTVVSSKYLPIWGDFLLTFAPTEKFILGDINGDDIVDMVDTSLVVDAFLSDPEHPLWSPDADFNMDNSIDMADVAIVVENFGKTR